MPAPSVVASLRRARRRSRLRYLGAVLVTVAVGLGSRRFPHLVPAMLGKYPGDALWALMVFFGLGALFNRAPTARIAAGALACAFTVEFLKLAPAPWLAEVRRTTLGHLVFGHTFWWPNFAAYAVGVATGVLVELSPPARVASGATRRANGRAAE